MEQRVIVPNKNGKGIMYALKVTHNQIFYETKYKGHYIEVPLVEYDKEFRAAVKQAYLLQEKLGRASL